MGVDRRGGKNYQDVPCVICGGSFFASKEAESGVCAQCVVMGYPRQKPEINILEVAKSIEENSLRQFRKKAKLSQDMLAKFLGISRVHYCRIEEGRPIGKNVTRKIEKKLAQAEQSQ
jgi:DNA-binding XRE family transcriptional regulator